MKKYIVGVGMGVDTLTAAAEKVIKNSDALIGAERMLKPFQDLRKVMFQSYDCSEICRFIANFKGDSAAVLVSGDVGFFSLAKKLLQFPEFYDAELICGISTPVYFCSKINRDIEKMKLISLHGNDCGIAVNVRQNRNCCFILGGKINAGELCRRLTDYGLGDVKVWIGENFGCENERIRFGTAAEFIDVQCEKLAAVITENSGKIDCQTACISDDQFIRSEIPMTKAEIRCIALAELNIQSDNICWDIGSGSGSVTVEMALKCHDGMVWSIDKFPEAVELTKKNCHKFSCDNVIVKSGVFPEIEPFAKPDCVFVGGSGGRLDEILNAAYNANPAVKIVVTAVSLETISDASKIMERLGMQVEITQIAVTRTRKIGKNTMFNALNPIFIIRGEV